MTDERAPTELAVSRILVGVAHDELSDHAVSAARELARFHEAELDLVHAVAVPELLGLRFASSQVARMAAEMVEQAGRHVARRLADLGHPPEVTGKVRTVTGRPSDALLTVLRETGADLVVLGASGHRRQLDFGGTARALYGHARVPIWLQVDEPRPIHRVVAPVDLSEHSLRALALAVDVARRRGAKLTALYAHDPVVFAPYGAPDGPVLGPTYTVDALREGAREEFDKAMAEVDWRGIEHEAVFVEREPREAILEAQDEADLIVLGTHGHTGLAAALLGSVAYGVLRRAHVPVLSLPMPHRTWLL